MSSRDPSPSVDRLRRVATSLQPAGVVTGWMFLYLSLTPSLLPRTSMVQGALSGITAAVGYGVGVGLATAWHYLELPRLPDRVRRPVVVAGSVVMGLVLLYFLLNLVRWQNDVRRLFGMDDVGGWQYPVVVVVVAVLVTTALIGLVRAVRRGLRRIGRFGGRLVPGRVGRVLGYAAGVFLLFTFVTGVLVDGLVAVANQAFSVQNGSLAADVDAPSITERSGSPDSLVAWETLGRPGRSWVARGPRAADIERFTGEAAVEPIRVYAGIDSADSVEERADLLLDELIRTDAFERDVLVLATSTGSGGIDPRGTGTLEYMHGGDTAIAAMQYSFLPSWISYFVDQAAAREAATVTFERIHDHWRELDPLERPRFYLFGVSLGSFGSETSARSLRVTGAPIDGAVWAGPTFNNDEWVRITDNRDAGSSSWLPIYDDGSVVRFTGRENALDVPEGAWADNRFVYIQHGSDPVSFFSPDLLLGQPDWLQGEQAPDVSKHMNWYPFVTFWQVALDLPAGGSVPRGFGHNFGASAYVDAWVGVTDPAGWSEDDSARLAEVFERDA